ncbi:hypothetical protein [Nocardioides massiliensis]|uniref:Uncharacterized protein n=1 Tax=Nocardioides massiliensis TaxID=1325935 RepID=A0ABT9NU86_9ACTN|nr:hypothetical protein [Nocardioides massiliensis]MDP9823400.1 hypothetical protein [Nocardioides massiliensis]
MSKLDAQRAMREARYEAAAARSRTSPKSTPPAKPRASRPAETAPAAPAPPAGLVPDGRETGLCGHRSINGRTCTRESGHASKSHRYS